jgi:hypothetical protein
MPDSPLKNFFSRSSRGNEAQISLEEQQRVRASSSRLLLFRRAAKRQQTLEQARRASRWCHPILVVIAALVSGTITQLPAAAVDESKLPPAATNTVDYARDIRPILDASCLKCHGPEKPKSRFRVDDREALLKGGENGVAVVPAQSGKSPLIH